MAKNLIIGAGQQGGSLMKLRLETEPTDSFVLYDISEDAVNMVQDFAGQNPEADIFATMDEEELFEAVKEADFVTLAVPVGYIPVMLKKILPFAKAGALILDMGSEKVNTTNSMRKIHKESGRSDVGVVSAHPGVGAAGASFSTSRADMFRGKPFWVMKPEEGDDVAMYEKCKSYLDSCGARVVEATPEANDVFFSNGSWDTHLKAFVVQDVVSSMAGDDTRIVGPSVLTALRICFADPQMWVGIMDAGGETLRENVSVRTRRHEDAFVSALREKDRDAVLEQVRDAHEFRKRYTDVARESVFGDIYNISKRSGITMLEFHKPGGLCSVFNNEATPDVSAQIAFPAVLAVTHLLKMRDIAQDPVFEGIDIIQEGNPSFKDFTALALNDPEWLSDLLLSEPVCSLTLDVFEEYRQAYESGLDLTKDLKEFGEYVEEVKEKRSQLPPFVKGDDARGEFHLEKA